MQIESFAFALALAEPSSSHKSADQLALGCITSPSA